MKKERDLGRPSGRPSNFKPELHPDLTYRLCCVGLTDADLAFVFDVSEATLNNWKSQHGEFSKRMKQGKTVADAKVAHSLFKRATGYEQIEKGLVEIETAENGTEMKPVEIRRHIPADVNAIIIWLRNRTGFFKQKEAHVEMPEVMAMELKPFLSHINPGKEEI
ncbi:hypothetical protein [Dyadobacter crusticola]|uniref:hypothetical protein n=1 Tax=Dyadobacter crusticola TaxID=292407 RepID=UPI00068E3A6C|nr:hypothetical protein [Dyadobacter crusticola]